MDQIGIIIHYIQTMMGFPWPVIIIFFFRRKKGLFLSCYILLPSIVIIFSCLSYRIALVLGIFEICD